MTTPTSPLAAPARLPVRCDKRYSAALTIRYYRTCRRMGAARFTNEYIRGLLRGDQELCWN